MRTISFKTVGCRLNQAETTELSNSCAAAGFTVKPFGQPTDIVVVHTCAVTAKAEKDCVRIARVCGKRALKPFIVLAGCAAEVSAPLLQSECGPDLIVGQADKFTLPKRLAEIFKIDPSSRAGSLDIATNTRAAIEVQSGCAFHCTYWIVPSARGLPSSISESEIISRAAALADEGFKEVILTGANLGCFGSSPDALTELLNGIEAISGIKRIRLSSIEITTAERRLVDYMTASEKVCRHLHIPLQSGSDSVLDRMHRKCSASEYRDCCKYALDKLPNLALGMDVIVGFPGETRAEFDESMSLLRAVKYDAIYSFRFSCPRSHPPAGRSPMPSRVWASQRG